MTDFHHATQSRHVLPQSDIIAAQVDEVCRRIAAVESGEVVLVPGDDALVRVRQLVASVIMDGDDAHRDGHG